MKMDGTIEFPARDSKSVEPVSSPTENESYEYLSLTSNISLVGAVNDTDKTDKKATEIKYLKFWKWNDPGIKISHEDKDTREKNSLKKKDSTAKFSRLVSSSVKETDTLDKDTSRVNDDESDSTAKLSQVVPASEKKGKTLYNEPSRKKNHSKAEKKAKHSRVVFTAVKERGKALDKELVRETNHEYFNDAMAKKDKALRKNKSQKSKLLRTRSPEPRDITHLSHNKRHKVQDDQRIRKFTDHVYRQALKAFEDIKWNSDSYTRQHVDALVKSYKEKFTDFVTKTRQTDIKTREGSRNVLIHIIETSNLLMERIVNFLKANMLAIDELGPGGLRGAWSKLDQDVNAVKQSEYEYVCKNFGFCRSSDGIRTVLLDVITLLMKLPDEKLIQFNDAATEQMKHLDFSKIATDETIEYIKKNIASEERMTAEELKFRLTILYGSLSKSHLPFIVNKAVYFEKAAVKRTVNFHRLIDALEEALPPTEANKSEWAVSMDRLRRWADGHPLDIQDILQGFLDNIMKGVTKSKKLKRLIADIVKPR